MFQRCHLGAIQECVLQETQTQSPSLHVVIPHVGVSTMCAVAGRLSARASLFRDQATLPHSVYRAFFGRFEAGPVRIMALRCQPLSTRGPCPVPHFWCADTFAS